MLRAIVLVGLFAGCASPRGGWDAVALFREEPALAEIPGQRIADLSPYPALTRSASNEHPRTLLLVACRYPAGAQIELRPEGPEWPADWAQQALAALRPDRFGIGIVLEPVSARPGAGEGEEGVVRLKSIADPDAKGPMGLGDTLTLCDVSLREAQGERPRGELLAGEVRIRRRIRKPDHRVHQASPAEWAATFLHELGHALGFAGHAAVGDSVVHLEQSVLRRLARRALAGEPVAAPNLLALHRLAPGRVLGRVSLERSAAARLEQVLEWVAARTRQAGPAQGPLSSVGDREARIAWRWPDGFALDLSLPRYVEELRRGDPVSLEYGPRTQRARSLGLLASE